MSKILIFAGTTEGRKLAEVLSGKNIELYFEESDFDSFILDGFIARRIQGEGNHIYPGKGHTRGQCMVMC